MKYTPVDSFFIDPYFANIQDDYWGQYPQNIYNMCKRMKELGMAKTYEDANVLMWWGREDLKKWSVPAWVEGHKMYGLKYAFDIPIEGGTEEWQKQQIEWLISHKDWDLSGAYLTYESGTAGFAGGYYIQQIKLIEGLFKPQYYFISPYANSVGPVTCAQLNNQIKKIAAKTTAWVVISPQDGVGAWNYPGAPYGNKCRDPLICKPAFDKVVLMAERLSKFNKQNILKGLKCIFRINAETFKHPALLAEPERFNAQVAAYKPLLGVGPCWSLFPEQLK